MATHAIPPHHQQIWAADLRQTHTFCRFEANSHLRGSLADLANIRHFLIKLMILS
jgi:hypothetical protein